MINYPSSVGRLAFLIGLCMLLTACGSSTAAVSTPPSPSSVGPPVATSGTLLLVKGDDVWSMKAGAPDVQLTHEANSNFANNPVFSPDASQIAYTYHIAPQGDQWGGAELHVMKADGSGDRTLVPAKDKGERAEDATWSPDGKALYFAHDVPIIDQANHYTGDTLTVERVDVASGQRQVIVKDAILPAISRSGVFAWVTYNAATSAFKLMVGQMDGSQGKALLSEKDFQAVYSPVLSPDGKTIAFAGSGRTDSKVASLGDDLADALNPLLPARAEAHGLPWDPWVIGTDGTGLKKVVSIGSDEMAISWNSEGTALAFSNLSSTYLVRPDGTGLTRLLQRGDPGGLDWRTAA